MKGKEYDYKPRMRLLGLIPDFHGKAIVLADNVILTEVPSIDKSANKGRMHSAAVIILNAVDTFIIDQFSSE